MAIDDVRSHMVSMPLGAVRINGTLWFHIERMFFADSKLILKLRGYTGPGFDQEEQEVEIYCPDETLLIRTRSKFYLPPKKILGIDLPIYLGGSIDGD